MVQQRATIRIKLSTWETLKRLSARLDMPITQIIAAVERGNKKIWQAWVREAERGISS